MIQMSRENLRWFNTAMHVVAFLELVVFAAVAPVSLLVAPEDSGETKSLLLPENASATKFVVGLGIATIIGFCLLIPAMWVGVIFCALRKAHTKKLGVSLIAITALYAIAGHPPEPETHAIPMIRSGIAFGCGLVALAATFLIVYSNRIERFDTSTLYQDDDADAPSEKKTTNELPAEAKQVIIRLSLFVVSVLIAFLVTFLLGRFTQFEKEPMYLTLSFFGMLGTSMLVTGLINEQTLVAFVPWAKAEKS
ncbi:hypothetical protein [Allorhodopirellula solitaria]|uniref:Uncharacterized protein n=1 Tax=Allorhodopirellula solitaria TaxID=2527987 RepID=A0A5C5WIZ1_9BACT|nr:hypothetical protein [Allorhodopirellula solitaria]TWT49981.1 hypothetical protein CA85_52890 [Allorhodopirellula solitaria]